MIIAGGLMTEINIIKNESKELILEFENGDTTIPDLIAAEISENPDVVFTGVTKDHPETGKPQLIIKTGKKKASEVLEKALESIDEQISEIKKGVNSK
jgi:DNA-directed RNA polymerase subunit L